MAKIKPKLYLSPPHMGGREREYVQEAFDSNWIAPLGPNLDAFEKQLCDYTGIPHAAALSSGTAALHLALVLLDLQPCDYVLCQSFTFSATVNPVRYLHATPVLIDSEPGTWNMDPALLERAIQDCLNGTLASPANRQREFPAKKPAAILPVHLYGMPARMDAIMEIAGRYGIPVIEDAAEALGSRYLEKHVGSFGKMAVLSFNGNKIITSSGGGALLSNDPALVEKARFLATQARDPAPHYQHSQIGYNYRMSNVVAGIGRGQMEVIEQRVRQKREIHDWYRENLRGLPGITFPEEPGPAFFSNRWLTTILVDPHRAGCTREDLRKALEAEHIESRPLWKPMHLQPVFSEFPAYANGISEQLFDHGLCLPSGTAMTRDDLERVAVVIKSFFSI